MTFLLASSAHSGLAQAPAKVDCVTLDTRAALPITHELCAETAPNAAGSAAREHFKQVMKRGVKISWSAIPSSVQTELLEELANVLGVPPAAPKANEGVLVIAPKDGSPVWLQAGSSETSEQQQMSSTAPGLFGSIVRYCMVDGQDGHYETSIAAFGMDGNTSGARAVALASLEPDNFRWDTPSAHGQAACDDTTFEPEKPGVAIRKFQDQVAGYAERISAACEAGNYAMVAYWTGYVLHAVQDLATHAGQTNPEHSFRAKKGQNPDANARRVQLGRDWGKATIDRFRTTKMKCYEQLLTQSEPSPEWLNQTGLDLFLVRDGTLSAKRDYLKLASTYQATKRKPGAYWFVVDNPTKATKWFTDNLLDKVWPVPQRSGQNAPSGSLDR